MITTVVAIVLNYFSNNNNYDFMNTNKTFNITYFIDIKMTLSLEQTIFFYTFSAIALH